MKKLAALLLAIPLLVRPAAAHTPIIDAGHGGFDGGAVSSTGVIESGLNLSISLRTASVMRLFGIDPVLIRETDTALGGAGGSTRSTKSADLKRRVEIINSIDGAFLISIHQNMFGDSRYGGAHIFYKGEDAKPLAEAIQADIRAQLDPSNDRVSKPVASGVYIFKKASCAGVLAECGFLSNARDLELLGQDGYQKKLALAITCAYLRYESGMLGESTEEG